MSQLRTALLLGALALFGVGGCSREQGGVSGSMSISYEARREQPGQRCPSGGVILDSGHDRNGDGVLGQDEREDVQVVCNLEGRGAPLASAATKEKDKDKGNGRAFLLLSSPVSPGSVCAAGGQRFRWGSDANDDGALDASELDGSVVLCHGSASRAAAPLITTATEPAGSVCPTGGLRVETGTDDDGDGQLDGAEVRSSAILCHGPAGPQGDKGDKGERGDTGAQGPPGPAGATALIRTDAEPPGTNCPAGGVKISVGVDGNGDGVLAAAEVTQVSYVCHGLTLPADAGTSTETSGTDAGSLCPSDPTVPCPVTIYDVTRGRAPIARNLLVQNVVVSGVEMDWSTSDGFFVQADEISGYEGPEYSGVFVLRAGHGVRPGYRVDLTAEILPGESPAFLLASELTIRATDGAPPSPFHVPAADVSVQGGSAALYGVTVRIDNATVSRIGAPFVEVTAGGSFVRVGNRLAPLPVLMPGETLSSISGIFYPFAGTDRLEPRFLTDYVRP